MSGLTSDPYTKIASTELTYFVFFLGRFIFSGVDVDNFVPNHMPNSLDWYPGTI